MEPRNFLTKLAGLLLVSILGGGVVVEAMEVEANQAEEEAVLYSLSPSDDLSGLGNVAGQGGIPILLMFSSPHCEYCERLESEVLAPMNRWEANPRRVIIGKLEVGSGELLRDFNGQQVSADTLAEAYNVDMFPTLVLLSPQGKTLVPKIIGYQTPEFYSAYLDAAIMAGQQLLAVQSDNGK